MAEGYSLGKAARTIGMRWNVAAYHILPGYREAYIKKMKVYQKKYMSINREAYRRHAREYAARWRKLNPEKAIERNRRHYRLHPEKCRARSAKYRKEHPEMIEAWRIKKRDNGRARRLRINALAEHYKAIISKNKLKK